MRATGGPAILVHSRGRAAIGPVCVLLPALADVHAPCSAEEKRQAPCRDRKLARACVVLRAACRAEFASEHLRPQSYGCSPPVRPDVPPLIGSREPASP